MLSKNRKLCHDLKIAYRGKGSILMDKKMLTTLFPLVQLSKIFEHEIVSIFLLIRLNKCFGFSKELNDGSFE